MNNIERFKKLEMLINYTCNHFLVRYDELASEESMTKKSELRECVLQISANLIAKYLLSRVDRETDFFEANYIMADIIELVKNKIDLNPSHEPEKLSFENYIAGK